MLKTKLVHKPNSTYDYYKFQTTRKHLYNANLSLLLNDELKLSGNNCPVQWLIIEELKLRLSKDWFEDTECSHK